MMGYNLTFLFSLKCLLLKYPIAILTTLVCITSFALAKMMQIIEAPLYELVVKKEQNYNDYRSFGNCLWNLFVTTTTGIIYRFI